MTSMEHLTEKHDGHTEHYWTVSSERGSVALSAHYFTGPGYDDVVDVAPSAAEVLARTADGWWVFDAVEQHIPNGPESGWSCPRHGDACDADTYAGHVANPIWQRLRTAGITDAAVFAELERLHAEDFGQVSA